MFGLRSKTHHFEWKSTLPFAVEHVFNWHTRPGAFTRLNPPWRPVKVVRAPESIAVGAEVEIRLPLLPSGILPGLALPWKLTHTVFDPPNSFCDQQLSGPFKFWHHRHSFNRVSENTTEMVDTVEYRLPNGAGSLNWFIKRELQRLFSFRHRILKTDLELHSRWSLKPRKTILIAGSSGFIGQALQAFLSTAGHSVYTLVRRKPKTASERFWDPDTATLDPHCFEGVDVVINLCGENIAAGRWTRQRKLRIEDSRVCATRLLAQTIAALAKPPELFISASGTGFYSDTAAAAVDEQAASGSDFLARVCVAWEGASQALNQSSCRNVQLRLGMVLNAAGGALAKLILPFKLGLGGRLGSGHQYISWIGLQDLLAIFEHVIYSSDLSGPINCVAPTPCTNNEFTKTLAQVLKRPALIPLPAFVLKAALGEMSDLLLSSNRVIPKRLLDSGYHFIHPELARVIGFI